jgi:hypothetical protein
MLLILPLLLLTSECMLGTGAPTATTNSPPPTLCTQAATSSLHVVGVQIAVLIGCSEVECLHGVPRHSVGACVQMIPTSPPTTSPRHHSAPPTPHYPLVDSHPPPQHTQHVQKAPANFPSPPPTPNTNLVHASSHVQFAHVISVQIAVLVGSGEVECLHGVPCHSIGARLHHQLANGPGTAQVIQRYAAVTTSGGKYVRLRLWGGGVWAGGRGQREDRQ